MKTTKHDFINDTGQTLIGQLYSPPKKNFPIVIVCHGYRSSKNTTKAKPLAQRLTSNGIGLFIFDFSGRGESDGKFEDTTITRYVHDLDAAISFCRKKTDKLGVVGRSLGGLVALQQAAKDKRINGLALMSPVSYFPWRGTKEFAKKSIKEWKEKGFAFTHSERLGDMKIGYGFYSDGTKYQDYGEYKKIRCPVLVLHGTKDKSVSLDFSKRLARYVPNSTLVVLKGADHMYSKEEDFEEVMDEISRFFNKVLI